MTTTIYVLRTFGGVLIVQSVQQIPVPTTLVAAVSRDGVTQTQTPDGIVKARTP